MAATVFCIRVILTKNILSFVIRFIKQQSVFSLLRIESAIYGTQIYAKINSCFVTLKNYLFLFDSLSLIFSFTYFKYHKNIQQSSEYFIIVLMNIKYMYSVRVHCYQICAHKSTTVFLFSY